MPSDLGEISQMIDESRAKLKEANEAEIGVRRVQQGLIIELAKMECLRDFITVKQQLSMERIQTLVGHKA